jgi:hypothetical protein
MSPWDHCSARPSFADAHARGLEGLEQSGSSSIAGLAIQTDRGIGGQPVGRLQERFRLGNRQDERQLPRPLHGRQIACWASGAEFLDDQELVQAPCHRDPSGHG